MPDELSSTSAAEAAASAEGEDRAQPVQPQPGEEQPAATPETLPPDVHPAVREAREKTRYYRDLAGEAFIFDANGNVVGIRGEFAEQVRQQFAADQPPAAAPDDVAARMDRVANAFAAQHGLLPDQVKGIIQLVGSIVQSQASELNAPLYESVFDQMKASMIASGEVPPQAAPFVERWVGEAYRTNPRAALTAAGRETILRQAVGEYALSLLRRRRAAGGAQLASPAAGAPPMLRPTPGQPGGPVLSDAERNLRQKMGLPATYTAMTPKEGA